MALLQTPGCSPPSSSPPAYPLVISTRPVGPDALAWGKTHLFHTILNDNKTLTNESSQPGLPTQVEHPIFT